MARFSLGRGRALGMAFILGLVGMVVASARPFRALAVGGPPATQSSPIAVTSDGARLLSVNPESNSVTLFDVTGNTPVKLKELKVGKDPESVAIHPDNDLAF